MCGEQVARGLTRLPHLQRGLCAGIPPAPRPQPYVGWVRVMLRLHTARGAGCRSCRSGWKGSAAVRSPHVAWGALQLHSCLQGLLGRDGCPMHSVATHVGTSAQKVEERLTRRS